MRKEVPKFLFDKRYLWISIIFITLFSMIFMVVYTPFTGTAWFGFDNSTTAINTIIFYIGGVGILALSKALLIYTLRHATITKEGYVLWLVCEAILIAAFYLYFTSTFILPEQERFLPLLIRTTICVTLILAIPYTFITLYAALQSKKEELAAALTRRHARYEESDRLINLYDYNGNLKLSVSIDSLYYMESQDNYVKVHYDSDGKLNNYMLRCRTKAVEEMCANTTMQRCHRSYIVNTAKIKLLKNERGNTFVVLDHPSIRPIPVSKTYNEQFMSAIEN